jgi:hypothetical protein
VSTARKSCTESFGADSRNLAGSSRGLPALSTTSESQLTNLGSLLVFFSRSADFKVVELTVATESTFGVP